jgi:membrane-associated phospholipid phosphatase
MLMLIYANPYLFKVVSIEMAIENQSALFLQTFLMTAGIPIFGVVLMKGLDMINSVQMEDKQERIGPFILVGLCYTWYFYNIFKTSALPPLYQSFTLGVLIALWVAFIINLFQKISLHTVGMGGFLAITIFSLGISYSPFKWLLIGVVLAAGLVGTSRLYLKAHTTEEVWGGYLIGFVTQLVVLKILM